MQLSQQQVDQFAEQGYLFFPALFSAEEIGVLNGELDGIFAGHRPENVREKGSGVVRTSFGVHMNNAAFARLARHPRMVEPIDCLPEEYQVALPWQHGAAESVLRPQLAA